jgi:hypothetical protein
MNFWYRIFFMIALLTNPLVARGDSERSPPTDAQRFVLFIHAGPNLDSQRDLVKKIAIQLARRGYLVRPPDNDRDVVGGPGVDYFLDADRAAADDIAAVVNSLLPQGAGRGLQPRPQKINNPRGYIGIWLF